jgi:heat shock protein HslJ
MLKNIFFIIAIQILGINTCTKVEVEASDLSNEMMGKWVLKYKFLGDAIDTPCGYAVENVREITLEISEDSENKGMYRFNGQSAVNQFFGTFSIVSTDSKTGINYIKVGPIGSTKMAGPQELMECEGYLFEFINNVESFRIQEGNLHLGRFKTDPTPSRDGGTYLIYERK